MSHQDPERVVRCKGPRCRAEVRWKRTEEGRAMLVQADPVPLDQAAIDPRGVFFEDDRGRLVAWSRALRDVDVGDLWRTHWGSCPDQDMFRRDDDGREGGE